MPWLQNSRYQPGDGVADIPERVGGLLADLQLRHFSYVVLRAPRDLRLKSVDTAVTNYPAEWVNRYVSKKYLDLDPATDLACRTNRPFFWGQGRFLRPYRKAQRKVFEQAREFQIVNGLSIPIHSAKGEVGIFSLSASNKTLLADATREAREQIVSIAYDTHDLVMKHHRETGLNNHNVIELTPRERECLSWTLEGKTAGEIADIIDLSVDTVNHYAQTSTRKLGASNKFHAAVKALRLGILS